MKHRRCPALQDRTADGQPTAAEALAKKILLEASGLHFPETLNYVSIFDDLEAISITYILSVYK
jgi:hypothetical protein